MAAGAITFGMDKLAAERMFLKIVETGSFAAAARRLGTSSGQASKLVSRLEDELGDRLLNRTTRALALTEAGQAYAEGLRGIVEALDDLATEVQSRTGAPRGTIRLTAPLSYGTLNLAPKLAQFALHHPQIALDVQFTDRVVNLVDEGFDAAVRVGNPVDMSLRGRKLAEVTLVTLAAPAYLAVRGTPVVPGDLAGHDCILDTNFRDPRLWTYAGGQRAAVTGRLSFSNASACLAAAEACLGITCIPDFVATESLAAGRVVAILTDHAPPALGVHFLYPGGRQMPGKLRALLDFLVRGPRRVEGAID